ARHPPVVGPDLGGPPMTSIRGEIDVEAHLDALFLPHELEGLVPGGPGIRVESDGLDAMERLAPRRDCERVCLERDKVGLPAVSRRVGGGWTTYARIGWGRAQDGEADE